MIIVHGSSYLYYQLPYSSTIWTIPIESMVLVYMLTWLGYIDGIHVTIYSGTMDLSWDIINHYWFIGLISETVTVVDAQDFCTERDFRLYFQFKEPRSVTELSLDATLWWCCLSFFVTGVTAVRNGGEEPPCDFPLMWLFCTLLVPSTTTQHMFAHAHGGSWLSEASKMATPWAIWVAFCLRGSSRLAASPWEAKGTSAQHNKLLISVDPAWGFMWPSCFAHHFLLVSLDSHDRCLVSNIAFFICFQWGCMISPGWVRIENRVPPKPMVQRHELSSTLLFWGYS
jgi:hypothetical protein